MLRVLTIYTGSNEIRYFEVQITEIVKAYWKNENRPDSYNLSNISIIIIKLNTYSTS